MISAGFLRGGSAGCQARAHEGNHKAFDSAAHNNGIMQPEQATQGEAAVSSGAHLQARARTYIVTRVVDGDTIEIANGEHVRLAGSETPKVGDCGYEAATANLERLVLDKSVWLTISDENRDYCGRLLRYVDIGEMDAGLRQIKAGLAIARYNSRDGYGYHPRENRYIAADNATPNKTCHRPKPAPALQQPARACAPATTPEGLSPDLGHGVCLI